MAQRSTILPDATHISPNVNLRIIPNKGQKIGMATRIGLRKIVENDGNADDVIAFFQDRFLPVDDVTAQELADEILAAPSEVGYLTISNALQWRLQYRRVIEKAGQVDGIQKIL